MHIKAYFAPDGVEAKFDDATLRIPDNEIPAFVDPLDYVAERLAKDLGFTHMTKLIGGHYQYYCYLSINYF